MECICQISASTDRVSWGFNRQKGTDWTTCKFDNEQPVRQLLTFQSLAFLPAFAFLNRVLPQGFDPTRSLLLRVGRTQAAPGAPTFTTTWVFPRSLESVRLSSLGNSTAGPLFGRRFPSPLHPCLRSTFVLTCALLNLYRYCNCEVRGRRNSALPLLLRMPVL